MTARDRSRSGRATCEARPIGRATGARGGRVAGGPPLIARRPFGPPHASMVKERSDTANLLRVGVGAAARKPDRPGRLWAAHLCPRGDRTGPPQSAPGRSRARSIGAAIGARARLWCGGITPLAAFVDERPLAVDIVECRGLSLPAAGPGPNSVLARCEKHGRARPTGGKRPVRNRPRPVSSGGAAWMRGKFAGTRAPPPPSPTTRQGESANVRRPRVRPAGWRLPVGDGRRPRGTGIDSPKSSESR